MRLFNAATTAAAFIDKFHAIKDIILLDRLASSSFKSICLECSSRRNDFLKLVGIDLAVSLLANFSLMPCFRVFTEEGRRCATELVFILFTFLYSLRCKFTWRLALY